MEGGASQQHANTPDQQPQQTAPDRFYSLLQHMVQTGMTAPYAAAAQFAAQNGEAALPLKAAEAGKEAAVVPGPPFSPPPASLPLNGLDQQTSLVSILPYNHHVQ